MFNRKVSFNLLSIHLQLVKILYIRLEYEGQSYITCFSVWRSWIILTECYVFIVVYLTTFTAAQTTCRQMVCWIMKCKRCRGKWFWPNELSRHLPGWTENHHKVLSWDIQALAWIQTWDFQNTKHEWWPPNCNAYHPLEIARLNLRLRSLLLWDVMWCRLVVKLPTFQDNLSVPSSKVKQYKTLEDGTNSFPWNVSNYLPIYTA